VAGKKALDWTLREDPYFPFPPFRVGTLPLFSPFPPPGFAQPIEYRKYSSHERGFFSPPPSLLLETFPWTAGDRVPSSRGYIDSEDFVRVDIDFFPLLLSLPPERLPLSYLSSRRAAARKIFPDVVRLILVHGLSFRPLPPPLPPFLFERTLLSPSFCRVFKL